MSSVRSTLEPPMAPMAADKNRFEYEEQISRENADKRGRERTANSPAHGNQIGNGPQVRR